VRGSGASRSAAGHLIIPQSSGGSSGFRSRSEARPLLRPWSV